MTVFGKSATMRATITPVNCAALCRTVPGSVNTTEGDNVSHNAGVAGSSPAPAITQTIQRLSAAWFAFFFGDRCATMGATKRFQSRAISLSEFLLAGELGAWS